MWHSVCSGLEKYLIRPCTTLDGDNSIYLLTRNTGRPLGNCLGYRYEQDMTAAIGLTEDAKEAQAAFREKRAPVFQGR